MLHDNEVRPMLKKNELGPATGGLTFPTIWKMMRAGKFPKPVLVTDGGLRWYADEVADWQASLPRAEYKPLADDEKADAA